MCDIYYTIQFIQKELDRANGYSIFVIISKTMKIAKQIKQYLNCPPNKRIVCSSSLSPGYSRTNTLVCPVYISNSHLSEDFIQNLFAMGHDFFISLPKIPPKESLIFQFMLAYYPEELL